MLLYSCRLILISMICVGVFLSGPFAMGFQKQESLSEMSLIATDMAEMVTMPMACHDSSSNLQKSCEDGSCGGNDNCCCLLFLPEPFYDLAQSPLYERKQLMLFAAVDAELWAENPPPKA